MTCLTSLGELILVDLAYIPVKSDLNIRVALVVDEVSKTNP